jgi:hypothetical protein
MTVEQKIVDLHNKSGQSFNGLTFDELIERFEQMTQIAQQTAALCDRYEKALSEIIKATKGSIHFPLNRIDDIREIAKEALKVRE